MKDNEFQIALGLVMILLLIIGTTVINERQKEKEITEGYFDDNDMFRVINVSDKIKLKQIKTNCSEYYEYNATEKGEQEHITDTIMMVGCILTELHSYYPNKTDEVLDKYNVIVEYDGFETSQKQRKEKLK